MKHLNEIKVVEQTRNEPTPFSGLFINKLHEATSKGKTENGAVTFTDSGSALLNFYAQAGSMRKNPDQALKLFEKAFSEDRLKAIKILFYLRDVRGGQGERDLFRKCLEWLGINYPEIFEKIVEHVPVYGRFDDVFFDNDVAIDLIKNTLNNDEKVESPTLLAKWLPTINASSVKTRAKGKWMAEKLGMPEIVYRKVVREIRKKIKTVEEQMSARNWSEINYEHAPSQASRIYRNAFKKHDGARYDKFIARAEIGEVKINASTLYPYQIYKDVNQNYSKTLEALWNQLPDYTQGKNALVVADTSGSMCGDPMSVSVSLALYFAERNKGYFQNHFISFSDNPKLHKVRGQTLREKMRSIQLGDVATTNLQAVFDLILNTAEDNNVPAKELPETIYIISDMEFNSACDSHTNYEVIKMKYENAGYKVPNIVFWNVDARSGKNLPARQETEGVALVSGFSPVIFKMAVENKTPLEVMLDTINSERYDPIKI